MDRGLYQREVAAEIGVNPDTVQNWEQGHTSPALRHWPALIEFLGFVPFEVGESLADRVRAWRTVHGVPRDELARRLSVDPSTAYRWEAGETTPQGKTREQLEGLLRSPPDSGTG